VLAFAGCLCVRGKRFHQIRFPFQSQPALPDWSLARPYSQYRARSQVVDQSTGQRDRAHLRRDKYQARVRLLVFRLSATRRSDAGRVVDCFVV